MTESKWDTMSRTAGLALDDLRTAQQAYRVARSREVEAANFRNETAKKAKAALDALCAEGTDILSGIEPVEPVTTSKQADDDDEKPQSVCAVCRRHIFKIFDHAPSCPRVQVIRQLQPAFREEQDQREAEGQRIMGELSDAMNGIRPLERDPMDGPARHRAKVQENPDP